MRVRDSSLDTSAISTDITYDEDRVERDSSGHIVSHSNTYGINIGHFASTVMTEGGALMVDSLSTGKKRSEHPCLQTVTSKRLREGGTVLQVFEQYNPGSGNTTTYTSTVYVQPHENVGSWPTGIESLYDVDFLSHSGYFEGCLDHTDRCRQAIQERAAVGVFLAELSELKGLVKTVKNAMQDAARRNPKRFADPLLAWEFGVKPFISDIQNIHSALLGYHQVIARLKAQGQQPTRIRTNRKLELLGFTEFTHTPPGIASAASRSVYSTDIDAPVAHAWWVSDVIFDLRAVSNMKLTLYAATRTFGFSNPAKVAWNLVPFSFVIDWLIPVSKLLNALDLAQGIIPSKVVRTTTHVKAYRRISQFHSIFRSPSSTIVILDDFPNGTKEEFIYRRWLGIPRGSFRLEDLTPRELWLSFLLTAQRFTKALIPFFKRLKKKDRLKRLKPRRVRKVRTK